MAEPDRQTWSVDETAAIVGTGRRATYEAIGRGEIPSLRIGKRIVVPKAALEAFLASATVRDTDDDNDDGR